ncbi:baseplate wedge subunit [Erwinia phage FBB1]|nr:baseplate wedge subunit [Erwinia phage FBB1]
MIFSFYDPIEYAAKTVNINSDTVTLTNIYKNYSGYFKQVIVDYQLKTYFIQGSPRPEELAYQLYGNTQYYWVLLMCNSIYDPFHGWITNQEAAYQSAIQRFQNVGGEQVLYHINGAGEVFYNLVEDPDTPNTWYDKGDVDMKYPQYYGALAAVDTYEDAIRKNEAKREIKIIDPSDIESFIAALIKVMEKA